MSRAKTVIFISILLAIFGFLQPANAILIDYGNGLIYDTVQDLTWYDETRLLGTWDGADAWASGLSVGGVTGWRLPSYDDNEFDHLYTALGNEHQPATSPFWQHPFPNTDPFTNLVVAYDHPDVPQPALYWTSEYAGVSIDDVDGVDLYYVYNFWLGSYAVAYASPQYDYNFYSGGQAIAVHDGNVGGAPVPEPATIMLLGTGLLGFAVPGIRKKFKK